ncbi:MAG: 1,6-anhydro-N-acetylmuramyl-L-alanine amidase AmpD [Marinobacter sp.]
MPQTPHSVITQASKAAAALRANGRIEAAVWRPSPNFGARPAAGQISLIVVHCISLPPGQFGGPEIENFFCNRLDIKAHPYFQTIATMTVSAHLLIRRDSTIIQFVSLLDRAWHAGRSRFRDQDECNDFSIGIELEGSDNVPYTEGQYQALSAVCQQIMAAWPEIGVDEIAGHSDIAPGRKTDPGPAFDWLRLHKSLAKPTKDRL